MGKITDKDIKNIIYRNKELLYKVVKKIEAEKFDEKNEFKINIEEITGILKSVQENL